MGPTSDVSPSAANASQNETEADSHGAHTIRRSVRAKKRRSPARVSASAPSADAHRTSGKKEGCSGIGLTPCSALKKSRKLSKNHCAPRVQVCTSRCEVRTPVKMCRVSRVVHESNVEWRRSRVVKESS